MLIAVVALGLGVDAYVHFDLASVYAFNRSSPISEGTLFRIEAVSAIVAALALVVRANAWTSLLAFAVAGGGAVLLLVYRYVDVGAVGPLPDMYEPLWFPEKSWSAVAEAVSALAATALLAHSLHAGRRAGTSAAARPVGSPSN